MASTQASSSNPSKKLKFTIIPPRRLLVDLTKDDDNIHTPSPIAKSSSPSPPNVPYKSPPTKGTSSTLGTTSYSSESRQNSSPFSSRTTPSPQPNNPFLDNPMDAPPRIYNPLPFKSHPSMDITLTLSHITSLDYMFETPSPSPPPPPMMGHPIFFNIIDYHGARCLCFFHNLYLILSLRDEMHFMFSHVEYILNFAFATPSPPHN
ncbi:hypothetical protein Tco_1225742 [Tanacetum coccineum]